jgi:hypothetical protein
MKPLDELAGGVAYVLLLIGAFLALHLAPAHAGEGVRLEVLAGQCQGERLPDGNWWSAHYPHELDLKSGCYQISISELLGTWRGWDTGLRLAYVDMGRMHVRAIWWLRDEDFHRRPDGHSCDPSTFKDCLGRGTLWQEVKGFTVGGLLERELITSLRVGAEGGLFVYEGSFQITVRPFPRDDTYIGWTSKVFSGWQLSPYLGVTVNSGYFMLAARRYYVIRAAEHGCGGCSGPTRGEVDMVYAGLQAHF